MPEQVINVGWKGKIYINTGTRAAPSLTELKNVADVKVSDSFNKDDTTTRADGGYDTEFNTTRKLSATWKMIDKTSDDANLTSVRTAYNAGSYLDLYFLDGVATNTKSRGVAAMCQVRKFDLDQANTKVATYDVEVSPAPSNDVPTPISGNASWTIN
ncbi:MAG: hypothetical protein U0941_30035 [Planctomycetaceae bacterium]